MSNSLKNLYRVKRKDVSKASRVLGEAFQNDIAWIHIILDEEVRREKLPIAFELILRYSLRYGEIYSPTEAIEGVAIWLPDKYVKQTLWRVLRSGAIITALRLGSTVGNNINKAFGSLEADREENINPPCMYLLAIGISPKYQGQGYGSKLLRSMFDNLDSKNIPIYLETDTERNAAIYKKLGFKVVKEGILHDLEFYLWEMIRRS